MVCFANMRSANEDEQDMVKLIVRKSISQSAKNLNDFAKRIIARLLAK